MNERVFEIGNVKFELKSITPMAAFDISEMVREALGNAQGKVMAGLGGSDDSIKAVAGFLMAIDKGDLKQIREALFKHVMFKVPDQPKALLLSGVEDMAFGDLDYTAIYEVIARAYKVNFTGCLGEMMNRLGIDLKKMTGQDQD